MSYLNCWVEETFQMYFPVIYCKVTDLGLPVVDWYPIATIRQVGLFSYDSSLPAVTGAHS